MGYYIYFTIITSSKEKLVFPIESEGLYKIHCMPGNVIESLDKIFQISIFQNMLVVSTEDGNFRNGFRTDAPIFNDNKSENNIMAFDLHGNFLWNIGSIVGDTKMAFCGCSCIFKEEAEKIFNVTIPCDTEILLKCSTWLDNHYIVDPINKKVVYKIMGKY